jgi:hypothetical protein
MEKLGGNSPPSWDCLLSGSGIRIKMVVDYVRLFIDTNDRSSSPM